MNCKQFNSIPLEEVLLSLGHLPTRQNEKEAWYLNPFASESEASFKLDKRQNLWFLHSEGIGGNNTDFMQKYLNASVNEVLSWAEKRNFSSFHQQEKLLTFPKTIQKPEYQITGIYDLQNQNLKNYLQERGLSIRTNSEYEILLQQQEQYPLKLSTYIWNVFLEKELKTNEFQTDGVLLQYGTY